MGRKELGPCPALLPSVSFPSFPLHLNWVANWCQEPQALLSSCRDASVHGGLALPAGACLHAHLVLMSVLGGRKRARLTGTSGRGQTRIFKFFSTCLSQGSSRGGPFALGRRLSD